MDKRRKLYEMEDELRHAKARLEMHRVQFGKVGTLQYEPPTFKVWHFEYYHIYLRKIADIQDAINRL